MTMTWLVLSHAAKEKTLVGRMQVDRDLSELYRSVPPAVLIGGIVLELPQPSPSLARTKDAAKYKEFMAHVGVVGGM
jgi:hypothetical protein